LKKSKLVVLLFILIALQLEGASVIAVFAPHPDDEAISLGGWIADQALEGAIIYGIMITDGEAFSRAVRANRLSRKPVLTAMDYLRLGKMRRLEGTASFKVLGIPVERQFFLAYPGNAINRLVSANQPMKLFKSPATRQRYGSACWQGNKRQVAYSRASLTRDIDEILARIKPDIVVIPAAFDTNLDHYATSRLITNRLEAINHKPEIMSYLVHRGSRRDFPKPYGYKPDLGINDPNGVPVPRRKYPSSRAIQIKKSALECHKSQLRLKDGFLFSFIRTEEIYW
jgi:LmbE family N-acetylglucosaminyl deacetylase